MQAQDTIVVAAPAGSTRNAIEAFVADKGLRVLSLRREGFPRSPRVVIEQTQLLIDDVDVLKHARAAIVVDSGMMWPVPMLEPTRQQWASRREDFDAYLRDERETNSFWFSCLDVLNDGLALCVNPQTAFALEATKLDAFDMLRDFGVPLAPMICSNDETALEEFTRENPGPWFELSLARAPGRRLDAGELRERKLEEGPILLQAVDPDEVVRLVAVQGVPILGQGPDVQDCLRALPEIQRALEAPWLDLWLRRTSGRWVVSDFSPGARLDDLRFSDRERVLEAVWHFIEESLEMKRQP